MIYFVLLRKHLKTVIAWNLVSPITMQCPLLQGTVLSMADPLVLKDEEAKGRSNQWMVLLAVGLAELNHRKFWGKIRLSNQK